MKHACVCVCYMGTLNTKEKPGYIQSCQCGKALLKKKKKIIDDICIYTYINIQV